MCFSSTASFGASIVLASTGVVAIARSQNTAQRVLACVPVLFAIQQFTEGILWVSLLNEKYIHLKQISTYVFLIFAQIVWPVYIPLAIFLFEDDKRRRRTIAVLAIAGLILAGYTLFCLFEYPVNAQVDKHHIKYILGFALSGKWYYGLLYFLPTILAPFFSGNKMLRWLGYVFLASYVISRLLFHLYVISVWCFFGAAISWVVLLIINHYNKIGRKPRLE